MSAKARVLIVDDYPFVREGIRASLRNHASFEVVGEAANGQEGLNMGRQLVPDLVIMDLSLPDFDGLVATQRLLEIVPGARVLVLTPQHRGDLVYRARNAGAQGCLAKNAPPAVLIQALETISSGMFYYPIHHAPHRKLSEAEVPRTELTEREIQVVTLLSDGFSNKEVASQLGISIRTVEKHRENILGTLGMHNIADLVRFAVGEGLVKLPPDFSNGRGSNRSDISHSLSSDS